jgi:cytochrome b
MLQVSGHGLPTQTRTWGGCKAAYRLLKDTEMWVTPSPLGMGRFRLWDLPTRLFHWSLAVLVVFSVITGKTGGSAIDAHGKIGLSILGLLAFRVVWGVIGSSYARFVSFFPTPASLSAYLHGQWRGVGHNPLGAFSVFGLLALLFFQVISGLLANDDIAFRGPLFPLISKDLSDSLTGLHKLSINLLLALIALHIGAIIFYVRVKKDNLLKPMLTGWKEIGPATGDSAQSATGGGSRAFAVALVIALATVYAGSGAWIPSPAATTTVFAAQRGSFTSLLRVTVSTPAIAWSASTNKRPAAASGIWLKRAAL